MLDGLRHSYLSLQRLYVIDLMQPAYFFIHSISTFVQQLSPSVVIVVNTSQVS